MALIYGPGNMGVDWAAGLVRGIERGLWELGASVATFTTAHHKEEIGAHYAEPGGAHRKFGSDSGLVRDLLQFLKENRPPGGKFDCLLGYFYDTYLLPEVKDALIASSTRLVNYPLNLLDQENHFAECLSFFPETWCSEEAALPSLERAHPGKIRYVPMASDPFVFRPVAEPEHARLLFVGSAYGSRGELLARCGEILELTVAGRGHGLLASARGLARQLLRERHAPPVGRVVRMLMDSLARERQPIGDEAFVRLASSHGVTVGFSDVRQETTGRTVHKVRLREYECAMVGSCHIARRLPELERGFENGKEILLYSNEQELLEQLRRVKSGTVDWREVGKAARRRSLAEHTWSKRFLKALA